MIRLTRLGFRLGAATMIAAMLLGLVWPGQASVSAATPTECTGGTIPLINRKPCVMYFSGRNISGIYQTNNINPYQWDVLINGTSGAEQDRFLNPDGSMAMNGTQFIAVMEAYLARGSLSHYNSDTVGAVFIIDTMLGQPGTEFGSWQNGYKYAMAHLTDWEQRVLYYDSQGWVKWNANETFGVGTLDSAHECRPVAGSDPHFIDCNGAVQDLDYGDFAFTRNGDKITTPVIDFHAPGSATHFRIRRICGNLIGNLGPLQKPAPYNLKPTVTPSIPGGATVATPGETVKFNYAIINNGQNDSPGNATCRKYQIEKAGQYNPPAPPGYDAPGAGTALGCAQKFPQGSTTPVGSDQVPIAASDAGHTICRTLTIRPADIAGVERGAEACVFVVGQPYFSVTGGDLSVGAGMDIGATQCTDPGGVGEDDEAGIVSWNSEGNPDYGGAGTGFAALALNRLQDFVTGQGNNNLEPSGLSFANTQGSGAINLNNPGSDYYGGAFGAGSLDCIPDYFNNHPNPRTNPGNTVINNGSLAPAHSTKTIYVTGGNVKINNITNFRPGSQTIIYVAGDAYINKNVKFPGTYNAVEDIPTFDLIVQGNIYVSAGSTELDGLYVAEPNASGNNGIMYTCASANGYNFSRQRMNDTLYNACDGRPNGNTLTIDGAVVAKQLWLERAYGTVGGNAAESINFTPETWLNTPPATVTGSGGTSGDYDAITSLPPVL